MTNSEAAFILALILTVVLGILSGAGRAEGATIRVFSIAYHTPDEPTDPAAVLQILDVENNVWTEIQNPQPRERLTDPPGTVMGYFAFPHRQTHDTFPIQAIMKRPAKISSIIQTDASSLLGVPEPAGVSMLFVGFVGLTLMAWIKGH